MRRSRRSVVAEDAERDVGTIGHEAVDAHRDEAAHVGRIVHGPHVHLDVVLVRCGDQSRRQRRASVPRLSGTWRASIPVRARRDETR